MKNGRSKTKARNAKSWSELLCLVERIQEHPTAFLPERSVNAIRLFLQAYEESRKRPFIELTHFQDWLGSKLPYPTDTSRVWWRMIELNSFDALDGYNLFMRLLRRFVRATAPLKAAPKWSSSIRVDLLQYLFMSREKPGLYFGERVSSGHLAAFVNGWLQAKLDKKTPLSRGEKLFLGFNKWLCRDHRFESEVSWHKIVRMWLNSGSDSFGSFHAYLDAYLTDYGKRPGGLDERFVWEEGPHGRVCRRLRPRERPSSVLKSDRPTVWWRSVSNSAS